MAQQCQQGSRLFPAFCSAILRLAPHGHKMVATAPSSLHLILSKCRKEGFREENSPMSFLLTRKEIIPRTTPFPISCQLWISPYISLARSGLSWVGGNIRTPSLRAGALESEILGTEYPDHCATLEKSLSVSVSRLVSASVQWRVIITGPTHQS